MKNMLGRIVADSLNKGEEVFFNSIPAYIRKLNTIHNELVLNYPFSDFNRIYERLGIDQPDFFGGNCMRLANIGVDNYRKNISDDVFIVNDQNGIHHAITIWKDDKLYLSDVAMLHKDIIDITYFSGTKEVTCYPLGENGDRIFYITLKYVSENLLQISRFKTGDIEPKEQYLIDLSNKFEHLPNLQNDYFEKNMIYNEKIHKFVYRVISKVSPDIMYTLIYPIKSCFSLGKFNPKYLYIEKESKGDKIIIRNDSRQKELFLEEYKFIKGENDIVSYIENAINLYFEHKPEDFSYSK